MDEIRQTEELGTFVGATESCKMLLMENELDRWYAISKVDAMLKNIVESDH
jgi:hypothetical protein